MSSHGKYDNAANAPYWAVNSTIVNATNVKANYSAPTADNVALLYANTTADVYTAGETIGLFGVDANEINVDGKVAHQGWVLRTTGSGGRAGRVQQEVLVAISNFNGDDEDTTYQDAIITIGTNPSANSVQFGGGRVASFTVAASITSGNTAAPLTYQWQRSATLGGSYVNVSNGTPANTTYSGGTTATLTVTPTFTDANNNYYRVTVSATTTGASTTSTPVKLTVTA
jgi:hypothetical protein